MVISDKISTFAVGYKRHGMNKELTKRLILEFQKQPLGIEMTRRDITLAGQLNYVVVGLRRSGKSYLLYQQVEHLIAEGHSPEEMLYFNFEDDRTGELTLADLDHIKVCYEELYAHRPIFFLDEIQNVDGWEHFARRIADQGFRTYVTGSNAKMLSREIAGTLGGRYMIQTVSPYSFREYLRASSIEPEVHWSLSPQRTEIRRSFDDYFHYGGLPEVASIPPKLKRSWLNNLFNKIFFGDILQRYNIRNSSALKIMVRKLAESVRQPCSFTRLANIVSSTGKKVYTETIIDYLRYTEDSCLIFSVENYTAKIADKATNKKYYFTDNGLLNLFLFDPQSPLLENMVAIALHSHFESELCFYLHGNHEVDFYLWEQNIGIQVALSIADPATRKREVEGIIKLSQRLHLKDMLIITYDEKEEIETEEGTIHVIPVWQWLLDYFE